MSDCNWLSDRMPAVALGRAEWTRDESQHLSSCRSCQEEWEVVQAAGRWGTGLLQPDHGATARAVLQRLQRQGKAVRFRSRTIAFAALAAAAAMVTMVLKSVPEPRLDSPPRTASVVAGRLEIPLPELESLQPAELDSVLRTMDEAAVGGPIMEDPGLADLDSDELQRVLESWEG